MTNILQHFRVWAQVLEDSTHLRVPLNPEYSSCSITEQWVGRKFHSFLSHFLYMKLSFLSQPRDIWMLSAMSDSCVPLPWSLLNFCLLTPTQPSPTPSFLHIWSLNLCVLKSLWSFWTPAKMLEHPHFLWGIKLPVTLLQLHWSWILSCSIKPLKCLMNVSATFLWHPNMPGKWQKGYITVFGAVKGKKIECTVSKWIRRLLKIPRK